jgi:anti-anti-sigma factor
MLSVGALGDIPIAYIDEDVDFFTAPTLRSLLKSASDGHDGLVISFERCRYCDASGITVLLEFQKRFGDRLAVVVSREAQFRRILNLFGLLRTLDVFESIEPAVARLQSTSSRNGRTQQYSAGA